MEDVKQELKTVEELKAELGKAIATGDDKAFNELIREINKRKSELAKQAAEAERKESEALAGVREKLAKKIWSACKGLKLDKEIAEMKAQGFTYKLDTPELKQIAVALLVPTIKAVKTGGNGGTHTTTEADYGLKLDEVFNKFATEKDRADVKAANSNSKEWQVKNRVKKAAIADGRL